ncbi:hypothetical protein BD414DRAFT_541127 [Trametes punicea]|nr:hypothetical protein BD414DRAFT_541127 [Trametes punicea]
MNRFFLRIEDSFGDESVDLDNHTVNLTQRTSLSTLESSMDETDVQDGVVRVPITPAAAREPSPPAPPTSQAPEPTTQAQSLGRFLSGSVLPSPPVNPPRSPSKSPGPATIPKPFSFSLPRASTPSKSATNGETRSQQLHRGTVAFAPPSTAKSSKRLAADFPRSGADGLSPPKRRSVGRLSAAQTARFEPPMPTASSSSDPNDATASQPVAGVAQRKSLGGGVLPSSQPSSVGLSNSGSGAAPRPPASVGGQPSGSGSGAPLSRTHSDPGPTATKEAAALYPDLTQLATEARSP